MESVRPCTERPSVSHDGDGAVPLPSAAVPGPDGHASSRRCYCGGAGGSWPLRRDDRFCSSCGRRVSGVVPLGPLLRSGQVPEVAAYLLPAMEPGDASTCVMEGRVAFQVVDFADPLVDVRGVVLEGTAGLTLAGTEQTSSGQLDVLVRCARVSSGPVGRLRLGLVTRYERLDVLVSAFVVDPPSATFRLVRRPGESVHGPGLVVYRGAGEFRAFVEFKLGGGVPASWGSLSTDHPAVTLVELRGNGRPAPVLRAAVRWDPTRLSPELDYQEISFQVRPLGLPPCSFLQPVTWRLRRPLACSPTGLVVPQLTEGGVETHFLHATNADRQSVRLLRVESDRPWVTVSTGVEPLTVEPGATVVVPLTLHPELLGDAGPPFDAWVDFRFEGRGRQRYCVRVESIRRVTSLGGELLIAPGPSRAVIAFTETPGERPAYLSTPGNDGVQGLDAPEVRDVAGYTESVIARARTLLLTQERRVAERVALVIPPWIAGRFAGEIDGLGPGNTLVDWIDLAVADEERPPDFLICIGAWGISVVNVPKGTMPRVAVAAQSEEPVPEPLDAAMAGWVDRALRPRGGPVALLNHLARAVATLGRRTPPDLWARLAIADLLENYRWGPALAWRRLQVAWWDHAPDARGRAVDVCEADDVLNDRLAEQARHAVRRARLSLGWLPSQHRPTCLIVSPIAAHARAAQVIDRAAAEEGVDARALDIDWVDRLARRQDVNETAQDYDYGRPAGTGRLERNDDTPTAAAHVSEREYPMPGRSRRFRAPMLALTCLALWAAAAVGAPPLGDDADLPHDLILAVDVSASMTNRFDHEGHFHPPNDVEGMRWDGVQFAVDLARPGDRIALVLFRGDAAVVSQLIDPSGYVRLDEPYPSFGGRTGRALLKAVVSELQDQDRPGSFVEEYRLASLGGLSVRLWWGTSVLKALETIDRAGLLARQAADRRAWAMIFTDGIEEKPYRRDDDPAYADVARHQYPYPVASYAYVAGRDLVRTTGDASALSAWFEREARPLVERFRAVDVPVMTFGLGGQCDQDLLRRIAESSQAPAGERPAASYFPATNLDLLDNLQRVEWELRRHWRLALEPTAGRDLESFRAPAVGLWHDLGLLLYRHRLLDGRPEPRALAPPESDVRPPRLLRPGAPPDPVPGLAPRVSRSHWYYFVGPDTAGGRLPADADLELAVRHATREPYATYAVAALRTRTPLFRYVDPAPGANYTFKDAIPLRVDFVSPARTADGPQGPDPIRAEGFQVEAVLTPAPGTRGPTRRVPLSLLAADPSAASDALGRREHRAEVVLDETPDSDGSAFAPGPYFVDVTIRGLSGPLRRAERRLIRRVIQIVGYPRVTLPPQVVVTNERDRDSARPKVNAALATQTEPRGRFVRLHADVTRGPVGNSSSSIETARFDLSPATANVNGRIARFELGLSPATWSELPAGTTFTGGELRVAAPWKGAAGEATAELVVIKRPYRVNLAEDALRFDLSGNDAGVVRKELHATLATDLDTSEVAWLAAGADRNTPAAQTLTLEPVEPPAGSAARKLEAAVEGLGRRVTLRPSATGVDPPLSLSLSRPAELPAGRYRAKVYLVGPSIEPTLVTVDVLADQPQVLLIGEDGSARPITDLYLVGLAGTRARRRLAVGSAVGQPLGEVRPAADTARLRGGGDQVSGPSLKPENGRPGRFQLEMEVPRCVREGWYEAPLTFSVASAAPLMVTLPIHLQVAHHGVRVEPPGVLSLRPEPPCAGVARADLQLATDVERTPVRWRVERLKPDQPQGAARSLPDGRLDLQFAGQSVLRLDGASNPVRSGVPSRLTVVAHCEGLEPGLYRTRLRFHSREDAPGAEDGPPYDLEVELLVPGRVIESATLEGGRPTADRPAMLRIVIASYACEAGRGEATLVDADGRASGLVLSVDDSVRTITEKDVRVAALVRNEYRVPLTIPRAGRGTLRVRWSALCNDASGSDSATPPDRTDRLVSFEAGGAVRVTPHMLYAGETAVFSVAVDPSALTGDRRVMNLRAVNTSEAEKAAVVLPLSDSGQPSDGDTQAGDGVYSARSAALLQPGDYDVRPDVATTAPVASAPARVGFELRQAGAVGTINYGGGPLARTLLGTDDKISVSDAIVVTNRRKTPCAYRVRLLFPLSPEDGRDLSRRDLSTVPTADGFDPRIHLDARLSVHAAGVTDPAPARELSGSLPLDGSLSVGVAARLSDDARQHFSGLHPTLGARNGMLVEVRLRWDEPGTPPLTRTILVPVSVATSPWYWRGLTALTGVAVLGTVLAWLFRRSRDRLFPRRQRATDEGPEGGRAPEPRRWPFRRREPGPPDQGGPGPEPPSPWEERTHGDAGDDDPWTRP